MTLEKVWSIKSQRQWFFRASHGFLLMAWALAVPSGLAQGFGLFLLLILGAGCWKKAQFTQVGIHEKCFSLLYANQNAQRLFIQQIFFSPWLILIQGKHLKSGQTKLVCLTLICMKVKDFYGLQRVLWFRQKRA